jgi:hypothetical protein
MNKSKLICLYFTIWVLVMASITLICGTGIYGILWADPCSPHPCEVYTYYHNDIIECTTIIYGKETHHCSNLCIDNIKTHPVGTHIKTSCYVNNNDFKDPEYVCDVSSVIEIPLLPPICDDISMIWKRPVLISIICIWSLLLGLCLMTCICLYRLCAGNFKVHNINDTEKTVLLKEWPQFGDDVSNEIANNQPLVVNYT